MPLQPSAKGVTVTQFEKDAIEAVGLVKIDLLGNRALATVDEARLHAAALEHKHPDAICDRLAAPKEDEGVVRMLQEGETLGITQLESPAMRHLLWALLHKGGPSTDKSTRHTAVIEIKGEIASGGDASAEAVTAAMRAAFEDGGAQGIVAHVHRHCARVPGFSHELHPYPALSRDGRYDTNRQALRL